MTALAISVSVAPDAMSKPDALRALTPRGPELMTSFPTAWFVRACPQVLLDFYEARLEFTASKR